MVLSSYVVMDRFSERLKRALLKFFMLDAFEFSEVIMQREVLENACIFAKQAHPKEFVALLGGKVVDKTLVISDLYYQEFVSSSHSASFSSFLPNAVNGVGTVHSHPSSNTQPSNADLHFFGKKGGVHFIVGYPYGEETISGYDSVGNPISFTIQ